MGGGQGKKMGTGRAWDKVCYPKDNGGLGIKKPAIMGQAWIAKIRWRWIKGQPDLWSTIRKAKYAKDIPWDELIRMEGHHLGSFIWNNA